MFRSNHEDAGRLSRCGEIGSLLSMDFSFFSSMWLLLLFHQYRIISIVYPNRSIPCWVKPLNSPGERVPRSKQMSDGIAVGVFTRDDLPFRYMSEQVSHHPPVSAFQCESNDNGNRWRFYGSILPKAKFSVKNMEVNPKGLLTLELKR